MNSRSGNSRLEVIALNNVPSINEHDDIAKITIQHCKDSGIEIEQNNIVIIAQKIISKSEGRFVNLKSVIASDKAKKIAQQTAKDPRLVELIIKESREIIRIQDGIIIVEHRLGHILANAGIDQSNTGKEEDQVLLLPKNPN